MILKLPVFITKASTVEIEKLEFFIMKTPNTTTQKYQDSIVSKA